MAMITLDFEVDERVLADDGHYDPAAADAAALEETYFVMPFRFSVESVELLGIPGRQPATLALPLLGFATNVHRVASAMSPGQTARCYLAGGGELTFERVASLMRISSSLTGNTVTVEAGELVQATRSLLERVRDLLLKRFPVLQTHRAWDTWFSS
jgi:hypothetical protein